MIERIPSSPPHIAPVPEHEKRPMWSVMIPAYNCSRYLENTIASVLAQDQGPDRMQIEVIDDCSTDGDIAALVARAGGGRVRYYRKELNMGSIRNFETCINRSKGHLVHILHGDDFVKEGFYNEIEMLYEQYPGIGAAFTDFYYVDQHNTVLYTDPTILEQPGKPENWQEYIATRQRVQPPAMVVKRQVYEHLGSFYAVKYGEDWEMWNRIAAHYEVAHSPKHLACYRVHYSNITGQSLISGKNIEDLNKVINIIQHYLPADKRKRLKKKAKENFATYFAAMAHTIYREFNNRKGALKQINGALAMHVNRSILVQAIKLYVKLLIGYKGRFKR